MNRKHVSLSAKNAAIHGENMPSPQNAIAPQEVLAVIQQDDLFQQWQERNKEAFLSHFFSSVTAEGTPTQAWEVGFFNPATEKITVFLQTNNAIEIKPADDVFKNESMTVEKLDVEKVMIPFEKARELCLDNVPTYFPHEQFGNGFVTLQTINGRTLWNFTFITRSLKFANVKINAETGEVSSHDVIELVQK